MTDDGDDATGDYPLNCIEETGDGFSGWFAISNPRQCNDFCFWHVPSAPNATSSSSYAAWNTANPHRSTVIHTPFGNAYWTCVYDSAGDDVMVSVANGESWVDSWHKHVSHKDDMLQVANGVGDDVPFTFLRCQKGAGERLKTWTGEVVKSSAFWEGWIALASVILVGEIAGLAYFCRRGKMRYEKVDLEASTHSGARNGAVDDENAGEISSLQIDDDEAGRRNPEDAECGDDQSFLSRFSLIRSSSVLDSKYVTPRCKYCSPLTSRRALCILRILLALALNVMLVFTISFSAISLVEIKSNVHYSERMQRLTPACSDPALVCKAGNEDIDRMSARWASSPNATATGAAAATSIDRNSAATESMEPFSYVIASDAQLYWFNGEFADMGRKPVPPACSPSDSCGRCTGRHGLRTNLRLKKAWESQMTGNGTNNFPVPSTLVMNGELSCLSRLVLASPSWISCSRFCTARS